jgi:AcrR family transcriptional regulator
LNAAAQPVRSAIGEFPHGRVPAAVRAGQLLDVAERLFAANGYGSTSIEGIAREAGVSRPVVYAHFGSKDGIYLACLERARGQLDEMLASAVASASGPREQLERGANAYFAFVERDPARWRVLFGGGAAVSGDVAERAMQLHLATERRFAQLFALAAPAGEAQALLAFAHSIGGAAHQLAQWWLRTPGVSRQQIVAWYCGICWDGLAASLDLSTQRPQEGR